MLNLIETAFRDTSLHTGHHIYPDGNLCAVERWLFNYRYSTFLCFTLQNHFCLVGRIAKVVTLENGYISFEKILAQRGIGIKNGIKLLLVCHTDVIRMDHRMSFAHLRAIIEYIYLGMRLI